MCPNILGNVIEYCQTSEGCHQTFQEMLPNIPGNALKYSRESHLSNILGNVTKHPGECPQTCQWSILLFSLHWHFAWLFASCASPIHLVDEFIRLFLVLLKEMRMLNESKVLPFFVQVLIKGMRRWAEPKIFFYYVTSRGGKLLLRRSTIGVV